ncbi:MAG: hypothetical protein ACOC2Y_07165 [Spirochaetota bacterium]
MKRIVVIVTIALVVSAGVSAQDLSGLGRDFEVLIEELGAEILPDLEQSAIWGQYTGGATYADDSGFFLTLSTGALLTDGVLGFVDDPDRFTVLNVTNLFEGILSQIGDTGLSGAVTGLKTFFPVPVARASVGFALPGDVEAMIGIGGFPQFVTGWIAGLADADSLRLSSLHVGTKLRKGILEDAGPFPAISIGAGYSYSGFTFGYNLADIESPGTEYGQIDVGLGELNIRGDFLIQSNVHAFGFDLHASKQFGFFVPYVGVSPYFHFASFGGSVGPGDEFDAFVDYEDDGTERDVEYTGDAPDTAWVEDDLSFVLFGGFDMVFGNVALQLNGSWSVPNGSPGVTINVRRQ